MTKSNYIFVTELALTHQEVHGKRISQIRRNFELTNRKINDEGRECNPDLFRGSDEIPNGKGSQEANSTFYFLFFPYNKQLNGAMDTWESSTFWKCSRNSSIILLIYNSKALKDPLHFSLLFFQHRLQGDNGRWSLSTVIRFAAVYHFIPDNILGKTLRLVNKIENSF